MRIPFNRPYYTGREADYIKDALTKHTSGDGIYTKKAAELLQKRTGAQKILMTTSGTHALEMAAYLAGLKPGDEVIVPSFTFPSTANCILRQGAIPVFADIEETTLTLDPDDVMRKLTPATKAIFPVHYGGVSCNMDKITEIARPRHLVVVEDAAQGVNAQYKGKYLGTIGDFGCYSFHATKNYISGEGGALLINTEDESVWNKARAVRHKGTDRESFLLGEVAQYSWVEWGSNYTPSDLLMALLCAQLEAAEEITAQRKAVYDYYAGMLEPFVAAGLSLSVIPSYCESNYHIFYIILPSNQIRTQIQKNLRDKGIECYTHFVPLHLSAMGRRFVKTGERLPVTESISERLLRLPLYPGMKPDESEYVAALLYQELKKGLQQ